VKRGGVLYSIYGKVNQAEDFDKKPEDSDDAMIVLYFEDSVIDLMGEILGVPCRLSMYDAQLPYKSSAADMFD